MQANNIATSPVQIEGDPVKSCCEGKTGELAVLRFRRRNTLRAVLAINAVMFMVEAVAGWLAKSSTLTADSLDMFGDAGVYALTIYVLDRGRVWRARAALAKGALMGSFELFAAVQCVTRLAGGSTPGHAVMGGVGALALAANLACLLLLLRYRSDDLHMRSTWLCSRNDVIANIGVISAAALVSLTKDN